jgi:hypothetical protein
MAETVALVLDWTSGREAHVIAAISGDPRVAVRGC